MRTRAVLITGGALVLLLALVAFLVFSSIDRGEGARSFAPTSTEPTGGIIIPNEPVEKEETVTPAPMPEGPEPQFMDDVELQ